MLWWIGQVPVWGRSSYSFGGTGSFGKLINKSLDIGEDLLDLSRYSFGSRDRFDVSIEFQFERGEEGGV